MRRLIRGKVLLAGVCMIGWRLQAWAQQTHKPAGPAGNSFRRPGLNLCRRAVHR